MDNFEIKDGVLKKYFNREGVKEFSIPEGTVKIDSKAFVCADIEKLYIPASIEDINYYAIFCCDNLQEIVVSPDNPYFISIDGVLYNKDMTRIIFFPPCFRYPEYSIPETVSIIDKIHFSFNLRELRVHSDVDYIDIHSFLYCDDIRIVAPVGSYAIKFAKSRFLDYKAVWEKKEKIPADSEVEDIIEKYRKLPYDELLNIAERCLVTCSEDYKRVYGPDIFEFEEAIIDIISAVLTFDRVVTILEKKFIKDLFGKAYDKEKLERITTRQIQERGGSYRIYDFFDAADIDAKADFVLLILCIIVSDKIVTRREKEKFIRWFNLFVTTSQRELFSIIGEE